MSRTAARPIQQRLCAGLSPVFPFHPSAEMQAEGHLCTDNLYLWHKYSIHSGKCQPVFSNLHKNFPEHGHFIWRAYNHPGGADVGKWSILRFLKKSNVCGAAGREAPGAARKLQIARLQVLMLPNACAAAAGNSKQAPDAPVSQTVPAKTPAGMQEFYSCSDIRKPKNL